MSLSAYPPSHLRTPRAVSTSRLALMKIFSCSFPFGYYCNGENAEENFPFRERSVCRVFLASLMRCAAPSGSAGTGRNGRRAYTPARAAPARKRLETMSARAVLRLALPFPAGRHRCLPLSLCASLRSASVSSTRSKGTHKKKRRRGERVSGWMALMEIFRFLTFATISMVWFLYAATLARCSRKFSTVEELCPLLRRLMSPAIIASLIRQSHLFPVEIFRCPQQRTHEERP